jgi:biopolymer transport protein ExbD
MHTPYEGWEPPLLIQVSAGRDVYVNRELADIALVPRLIKEYQARLYDGQESAVIITGDDLARHGALVRAIDIARGSGIDRILAETAYRPTGR